MNWSPESFWAKTLQYMNMAVSEYPESPLFPYWAILSLEFLAKGALSYIHPVLLVDLKSNNLSSLIFATNCGLVERLKVLGFSNGLNMLQIEDYPETLTISEILNRICKFSKGKFTLNEVGIIKTKFLKLRNEEVHGSSLAFRDLLNEDWLTDFYSVTKILVEFQEKTMAEFWQSSEMAGKIALQVKEIDKAIQEEVDVLIKSKKLEILAKPIEEEEDNDDNYVYNFRSWGKFSKIVICPCCEKDKEAFVTGEPFLSLRNWINNIDLVEKYYVLPDRLQCFNCGLELEGYDRLKAASFNLAKPYYVQDTINIEKEFEQANYREIEE